MANLNTLKILRQKIQVTNIVMTSAFPFEAINQTDKSVQSETLNGNAWGLTTLCLS